MLLKNKALFASAGTGKTYQLTNRFIQILHHTEKPERIIALTFTRASAGEFFKKIIEKLYVAANSEEAASKLSEELNIKADTIRYTDLIECMLKTLHKQNLQTLDSFLYQIISSFTTELGIPEPINLLSENSANYYQKQIQDSIIYQLDPNAEGKEIIKKFWYAFNQSNYGGQKRSIEKTLSNYIQKQHQLFLETPEESKWGNFKYIWGSTLRWFSENDFDWDELSNNILKAIPDDSTKAEHKAYESAADDIKSFPKKLSYRTTLERCIDNHKAIFSGDASIIIRNKQLFLKGALCEAIKQSIQAIFSLYIKRSLERTQGTYKILEIYDHEYDRLVRKSGKLTFSDLVCLLNTNSSNRSFNLNDPFVRDLIDYRLDAQFDHWLFDEFQDTSRQQWNIVSNLVEEVLQDTESGRSVFFVGDTKQSLYLWRNSDDRLYQEICENYDGSIELPEPLNESYRSSPAIMEAVNRVFNKTYLIEGCFGKTVSKRWKKAWKPHFSNSSVAKEEGFATWIEVDSSSQKNENYFIYNILKNLEPKLENLSVGILVRKNDEVKDIAYYLREQNLTFPIKIGSSQNPAKDTSVGVTLLTMLNYCIYPSDLGAERLLKLIDASTNGVSLVQTVDELRPFANSLLTSKLLLKFSEVILSKVESNDERHRNYLSLLIENSRKYEKQEKGTLSDLIPFLENYQFNEPNTKSSITIETIHRSKGLEYDVVILMNNDKRSSPRNGIQARRDAKQEVDWILEPFKKDVMQALPKADELYKQMSQQEHYSALCNLYVGMTRAKKALYMINDRSRVSENSLLDYLKDCLMDEAGTEKELFAGQKFNVLWSTGDVNWHSLITKTNKNIAQVKSKKETIFFPPTHKRLKAITPSRKNLKEQGTMPIGTSLRAIQFGEQVHRAFQLIEWYETKKQIEGILDKIPSQIVSNCVLDCFNEKPIQTLFKKENDFCEVWREKPFSYSVDHSIINGTFDRVQICKDTNGTYLSATIIDFKTDYISKNNTLEASASKHKEQIQLYHRVLSKLLNLDPSKIRSSILFTHAKKIHYFSPKEMAD